MARVLVVEDQRDMQRLLVRWIEAVGYQAEGVGSAEEAIAAIARSTPDVVCLDLHLPGMQGLEALQRIRTSHASLPVVMLTAAREVETVVAAMQLGAFDYLPKPPDQEKLIHALSKAIERRRLAEAPVPPPTPSNREGRIVGASTAIRTLLKQIEQVAVKDITVLIHGESGTGKELVARAIHDQSARRSGPFIAHNGAGGPETLQESDFFGHEKGAFTGATSQRKGLFEQADGGTLFLDEVAELGPGLQAKLLRVLQERRFVRVGGTTEVTSTFRLLAASHCDLARKVREGSFREDLFFRIAVFELELPPLRDRGDDVLLLAQRFASELSGGQPMTFEPDAEVALLAYGWPGNVRELQNAMQRALVLATDEVIRLEHLPARVAASAFTPEAPAAATADPSTAGPAIKLEELERKALEDALERTNGNVNEVVRQLGIGRTTVYRKMRKFGLR